LEISANPYNEILFRFNYEKRIKIYVRIDDSIIKMHSIQQNCFAKLSSGIKKMINMINCIHRALISISSN